MNILKVKQDDQWIDIPALIGPRGVTFTPSVDTKGNLSWTNDGNVPNPPTVNIKGQPGEPGTSVEVHICGAAEYDENGVPTVENPDVNTFYLVPDANVDGQDMFVEWVNVDGCWEIFGSARVDLSNYVQKTDYATSSMAGVVKVGPGLTMENGFLYSSTPTSYIKSANMPYFSVPINQQHASTFYGLAKAAGDTTQSQSDNAIGTYTDEAKAAIQTMLDVPSAADLSLKADKTDTVLETTLSRGRTGTVGDGSIAFGEKAQASGIDSIAVGFNVNASGRYSTSFGAATKATGDRAVANGMSSVASGPYSHAEGDSTVASGAAAYAGGAKTESSGSSAFATGRETLANKDVMMAVGSANTAASQAEEYPTWVSGTLYHVGDKVYNPTIKQNFECLVENNDVSLNLTKWRFCLENSDTLFVVGNGKPTYSYFDDNNSYISVPASRSNAFRVDWDGNGKFNGDVYVGANADSSGGTKVATVAELATKLDAAEAGLKVVRLI